jgi:hypothetical protein
MAATFLPPANLDDFDYASSPALKKELYDGWHERMKDQTDEGIRQFPAYWSAIEPPAGAPEPKQAAPEWTGMPRTIKRLVGPSIADAAKLIDEPRAIGDFDPVDQRSYPRFTDETNADFPGPSYRSQDEYLEWVTRRDASNTITEIIFTAEGPEYWEHLAKDKKLLHTLYEELCGNIKIPVDDLFFPKTVFWRNPYGGGRRTRYNAGAYNPYNRWNMAHAIHLSQPANTLGAEINLAMEATLPYGNPVPVNADPDLACCAMYGGINRMSDPTIGSGVNTQVDQLKRKVTLRNPIGLYIKGLAPRAFTLPNGTPFLRQDDCWKVLRPKVVTDMIVRASFRVPDDIMFNNKQLRVGDLLIQGERVETGGQVADIVTMTLYALAIPGAPPQARVACRRRPCPDKAHKDFIQAIPFGDKCPPDGISPQFSSILLAKEKGAMAASEPAGMAPMSAATTSARPTRVIDSR